MLWVWCLTPLFGDKMQQQNTQIDIPYQQIHKNSLYYLGTDTSIKSVCEIGEKEGG